MKRIDKFKSSRFYAKILPVILAVLVLWAGSAAVAQACGGFISQQNSNVKPDKLTAAIVHDGQRETLIMQLNYNVNQGSVQDFGWVMPVPAKPNVAAAPDTIFTQLSKAVTPKKNYLDKLNGGLDKLGEWSRGVQIGGVFSGNGAPGAGGARVVSQTEVGAFDVTVLAATDQSGLQSWADKNGYSVRNLTNQAVQDYIDQQWYFVLAKLNANRAGNSPVGQGQPIALTFDSAAPIYPWRLAAYNINGQLAPSRYLYTDIYLLKPDTRLAFLSAPTGITPKYAENLSETASRDLLKGISGANGQRYFLTYYSGSVDGASIDAQDLKFERDSNQDELNSGKLVGIEWLWAGLLTFFFVPLALLAFLNVSIPVVLIGLGLVYGFARANRRKYFVCFLVVSFVWAALLTVAASADTGVAVLLSLVPSTLAVVLAVLRLWPKTPVEANTNTPVGVA